MPRAMDSDEALKEFKEVFQLFDDGDKDEINCKQLEKVLVALGKNPTQEQLAVYIKSMTGNEFSEDAKITLDQFMEWIPNYMRPIDHPEQTIIEAFKRFDKDHTGFITCTDLRKHMTEFGVNLTSEEVDELIQEADSESSGKLSYEGFIPILIQK